MSVVRQLVQIAVVEAVRNRTLAGNDVFDSRMDTLDSLLKGERRPLLIFSIEEAEQEVGGQGESGLLGRAARLTAFVQAGVASGEAVRDGNNTIIRPAIGETDAAYEATLNILDRQWRQILHDFEDPWAVLFRELVTGVGVIKDTRASDPETGSKHAARFTQFHLNVIADPLPGDDIPECIAAGLDLLEADGDAGYAQIAGDWRALLSGGQDWPAWRQLQSSLFASRGKLAALGHGPLEIDDEVDFETAIFNVAGATSIEVIADDP